MLPYFVDLKIWRRIWSQIGPLIGRYWEEILHTNWVIKWYIDSEKSAYIRTGEVGCARFGI